MTRRTGRHRGEKAADQNIRPVFKKKKKKTVNQSGKKRKRTCGAESISMRTALQETLAKAAKVQIRSPSRDTTAVFKTNMLAEPPSAYNITAIHSVFEKKSKIVNGINTNRSYKYMEIMLKTKHFMLFSERFLENKNMLLSYIVCMFQRKWFWAGRKQIEQLFWTQILIPKFY